MKMEIFGFIWFVIKMLYVITFAKRKNNVNNTSNNRSQKIYTFINETKREQINSTTLGGRDKVRLFPIVQLGMTTLEHVIHSIKSSKHWVIEERCQPPPKINKVTMTYVHNPPATNKVGCNLLA